MTDTTQTPTVDLGPQAEVVARLAAGVTDEQLADPTPCPKYAVRNVLAHLAGLAVAFRDAGRKDLGVTTDTRPDSTVPELGHGWREELPRVLGEMAEAWRDPAAWTGMTRAGSVDLPGGIAGLVATDELVVHGWDLARATGQRYEPDPAALRVCHDFLAESVDDPGRGAIFGPVVTVEPEASLLARAVGLSGRDPEWAPQP
ncbi:TIGR03086 family protein [Streptomyces qaidamensis]|uniref:TIGR03086 family protein n=1 Tax=Streptomyces qaidamensis TaxID=1783515 RepID=A0A143CCT8_9ACTN|nr:TIGR03086 family metal-binding protein [Streptomyces qaidamensis]AMW15257.1 TIGR03086 family protein [Streptomyces qaidamensis]